MPLPDTLKDVLLITLDSDIIQGRLRLEKADFELHTAMLEAVPQYGQKAVHHDRIFKALIELLVWIRAALPLKPLPHVRLCRLHEPDEHIDIQRLRRVVACVRSLDIASGRRDQVLFYILFELFFIFSHMVYTTLRLPVTTS